MSHRQNLHLQSANFLFSIGKSAAIGICFNARRLYSSTGLLSVFARVQNAEKHPQGARKEKTARCLFFHKKVL